MSRGFAQVGDRIRKLAVLLPLPESDPEFQANVRTLKQALHRHGWIEKRNIELSVRSAGSGSDKIRDAVRATLAEQPDVILARSTAVVLGVKQEVTRIPVVFFQVSDPVGQNIVQSLARPGGNITGSTNLEPDLGGKWLEILKEIDPSIQKVALLSNMDTSPISKDILQSLNDVSRVMGVDVIDLPANSKDDISRAFDKLSHEKHVGLIVTPGSFTLAYRREITHLALLHHIPAIYPFRYFTEVGGLASYGAGVDTALMEAAGYIDKILRGANPADLPVQRPTKLRLTLNLRSAKAMGIEFPTNLLLLADKIIE